MDRLAKTHAQQGRVNEAVASFTEALPLATDRAARAQIITEAAALEGVLDKLAERAAGDVLFQAELTRNFGEHGNARLADTARTKVRTLLEEKLRRNLSIPYGPWNWPTLLLPPIGAKPMMAPDFGDGSCPLAFHHQSSVCRLDG